MKNKLIKETHLQFRIIFATIKQHLREIESKCGISGSQLWLLHEISIHPELGICRLAEKMNIHQSTCSLLIKKLENSQLIHKQRVKEDQRMVVLEVTKGGQEILANAPQPFTGILLQILGSLDVDTLNNLKSSLNQVVANLDPKTVSSGNHQLADL